MNDLIKKIDYLLNSDTCSNYDALVEIRQHEVNGIQLTRKQMNVLRIEGIWS